MVGASNTNLIRQRMLGLPAINTLEDFSNLTHISKATIYKLSTFSKLYYKTYLIPKKNGSSREISQPSKRLMALQGWVLVNILDKLKVSESCKGFDKGTSTSDNARPHVGAHTILNLDLEDFFHNIKREYVFSIFRSIGYNNNISTLLTNLCTYNDHLPQGGPCSPKLANLALWHFDNRIQGYVGKRGINYTRYADDLTFSGNNPKKVLRILPVISSITNDENFTINNTKTRVAGPTKSKLVTGLIINDKRFGVGTKKYKLLRAKIFTLNSLSGQKAVKQLNEIKGWISYLHSVDNIRYNKVIRYINALSKNNQNGLLDRLKPKK